MSLLKTGRPSITKEKALQGVKNEQLENLTIQIPTVLKKKLKIKAIHNNSTVTQIILDFIRGYVKDE